MRRYGWFAALLAVVGLGACDGSSGGGVAAGANPFLEDPSPSGKEDTFYLNPDGIEVEVDLEADVQASSYQLRSAPAQLGQFALTYLRKHGEFYLESLAEDASSSERVEWRVDGSWLTAAQAQGVDAAKLTHWRLRGVNAVLLHGAAAGVKVGSTFTAPVPLKPGTIMSDAGETCADKDSHLGLSQSIYWYQWNPDKTDCKVAKQDLTVTVSKMFTTADVTYPEYDQLIADKKITAVVLFGLIGDKMEESDTGFRGRDEMVSWLTEAGFGEVTPAPIGRRFAKTVGGVEFVFDLYSPREFSGLDDTGHFDNFQAALSDHEIVVYDGHSMLGASDFWKRPSYPKSYQVFLYGGCMGYEYYVEPILAGKGGWDKVDILSSVVEVSVGANEFAGPILAKLIWAAEHDWAVSWKDLLTAVRKRVGDSTFGVSGVRDNCYTPAGSRCGGQSPDVRRFEDVAAVEIPDNEPQGVVRVVDVPDSLNAKSIGLDLQIAHTWIGDLRVTLEHDGVEVAVWKNTGGDSHDLRQTVQLKKFAGTDVKGRWTLLVVDSGPGDVGTLESWALDVVPE